MKWNLMLCERHGNNLLVFNFKWWWIWMQYNYQEIILAYQSKKEVWISFLKIYIYFFTNSYLSYSDLCQKMNGLSIRELCCLFCCPPCPSRIAAKLAFLPPEPTYALLPDPDPGSGATTVSAANSGAAPASLGAPGLRSRLGNASGADRGGGGGGGGGGGSGGGGVSGGGSASSSSGIISGPEGRWKLHLTERAEFQYSQRELDVTDVFLTRSSRGNRVGCMYIRCAPNARWDTNHHCETKWAQMQPS